MKKLEFKPEDFLTLTLNRLSAASYAQAVFDQWFKDNIENAPVVYSYQPLPSWCDAHWYRDKSYSDTHKARIICIEPIEQPKKTKQVWQWRFYRPRRTDGTGICDLYIHDLLMDEEKAHKFFTSRIESSFKYEKHAGPFEIFEIKD